jgi:hypothetical protein
MALEYEISDPKVDPKHSRRQRMGYHSSHPT